MVARGKGLFVKESELHRKPFKVPTDVGQIIYLILSVQLQKHNETFTAIQSH